jgi:CPA1 family monovalent cation:H+ antiporter
MSWREFRKNLRPIALLAVGCVAFTTVAVAAVGHALLGLEWPVGFVLGAIVSPPDVVAPLAIARRLGLPRQLLIVLEGEGLANDATALVLNRFAVAAVSTGAFAFGPALGTFATMFVGEIVWGLAVGWTMLRVRRAAGDPRVEITLSLVTPYLAFWIPEHGGGSGVLATVACGLYVSWNGSRLIPSATRLQGLFFWDFFTFVIEGMVFLLTGLQARTLAERMGTLSAGNLVASTAAVCGVVIVARFVWVFAASHLRARFRARRRGVPAVSWKLPFMAAFTGIRGIVSLAAALAIPLATVSGAPFPHRDLILFVTFGVIVVTLVGQGLAMPSVIGWLELADLGRQERQVDDAEEILARRRTIEAGMHRLEELVHEREVPDGVIGPLRAHHGGRLQRLVYRSGEDCAERRLADLGDALELEMVDAERRRLSELMCAGEVRDEARRHIERDLDLREARLRGPT